MTREEEVVKLELLQALANGSMDEEDAAGRLRQFAAGCLINVRQISRAGGSESA